MNTQGKNIKHAQKIMQLLDAVQLPEKIAIMYIKAQQKVSSKLEEGNELADREAKEAAKGEVATEGVLISDGQISPEGKLIYNKKDRKLIRSQKATYNQGRGGCYRGGKVSYSLSFVMISNKRTTKNSLGNRCPI